MAEQLTEILRQLDVEQTGKLPVKVLLELFQKCDSWWSEDKLNNLVEAAGFIAEGSDICYADFVMWLMSPGRVDSPGPSIAGISPRPLSRGDRNADSITIRFIHINDVYDVEPLPSVCTAIRELSTPRDSDRIVTTMGGDFLAPYFLSTLDHGKGMLDCMNNLPIHYCCFGNHECDVPHASLLEAIDTFKGTWINSNMPGGGFGDNPRLPKHEVLDVASKSGRNRRKVGMLGLLCHDANLYREGVFNGAVASIEPVNKSCIRQCKELLSSDCDIVVPMTHQNSPHDKELALALCGEELQVPLILGGHDHLEVVEQLGPSSCTLVKAGMDATKIAVVDVTWESAFSKCLQVDARLLETSDFAKDAALQKIVEKHMAKVWAMDLMIACRKPDMEAHVPLGTPFPLSSLDTRKGEASMATLLCTAIRNAFKSDVAILEGGSVRGGNDEYYDRITMRDLKSELPFQNDTLVVPMLGDVLARAVQFSRERAAKKGTCAFFLHCDSGCCVDPTSHWLTTVAGKPFDPGREYTVALSVDLGIGAGVNKPLLDWEKSNEDKVPSKDLALPARNEIEVYFLRRMWRQMPSFDEMDAGTRDGYLTEADVENGYLKAFVDDSEQLSEAHRLAIKDLVQHLIATLDKAGDRRVSREEHNDLNSSGNWDEQLKDRF